MKNARALCVWTAAAAAVLAGCGDAEEVATRFDRPLGEGPFGAPIAGSVDRSILEDPASYTPATFTPLTPGGGDANPATNETPEAAAVKEAMRRFQAAVLNGEIDAALDAFPEPKVAALRESDFVESADELVTKIRQLWAIIVDKTADTDLAPLSQLPERVRLLASLGADSGRVQMLSETEALLVSDMEAFASQAESARSQFVPVLAALAPLAPPDPSTGQPVSGDQMFTMFLGGMSAGGEATRMTKVDDQWRIDLPITITAEHADALSGAALIVSDVVDRLTDQISAVDSLDSAAAGQLGPQLVPTVMSAAPQLLGALAPLLGDPALTAPGEAASATPPGAGDATPQDDGGAGAAVANPRRLTAAAGDDANDNVGGGQPSNRSAAAAGEATFIDHVRPLLVERCASCHEPEGRAARFTPLDLREDAAYLALVNQSSSKDESLVLVVPGDPEASYLLNKLGPEPTHGRQMPAGQDPLTDAEIELIRNWIAAGAANDGGGSGMRRARTP